MNPLRQFDALIQAFAVHGEAPGAVAAAGLVGAIAEAIAASASPDGRHTTDEILDAVADDTSAYWDNADGGQWRRDTPMAVAEAAADIARRSGRSWSANPADTRAAWILAVAAAGAAAAVADTNSASPTSSSAVIHGGTAEPADLPTVVAADGIELTMADGRTLADASAGLHNTPLGHRHPAPVVGLLAQASAVANTNPFAATTAVAERVANRLRELFGMPDGRVVFAASGSEAMETALRFGLGSVGPDEPVHALPGAFHGITAAAASLSSHLSVRGPLGHRVVPAVTEPISAWERGVGVIEPSGIGHGRTPLDRRQIAELVDYRARGGVVIVDEVLSGLGRTLWPGLTPALGIPADIVVLGKGLANGLVPVSAVLVSEPLLDRLTSSGPIDHGHTHSNHAASLGAVEGCLAALDAHAHDPTALSRAAQRSGIAASVLGWLAAVPVTSSPRDLVADELARAGVACHLPTMGDPVNRLVVAPPLTATADELTQLFGSVARVKERLDR